MAPCLASILIPSLKSPALFEPNCEITLPLIGHAKLFFLSLIELAKFWEFSELLLKSLELLLLGISLLFISYALSFDDLYGIITALFILTIGAAESAIGLSIFTRLSNKD